jgi:hypothetical protein
LSSRLANLSQIFLILSESKSLIVFFKSAIFSSIFQIASLHFSAIFCNASTHFCFNSSKSFCISLYESDRSTAFSQLLLNCSSRFAFNLLASSLVFSISLFKFSIDLLVSLFQLLPPTQSLQFNKLFISFELSEAVSQTFSITSFTHSRAFFAFIFDKVDSKSALISHIKAFVAAKSTQFSTGL